MSKDATKEKKLPGVEDDVKGGLDKLLILHNDDFNTFDHVIKALMEVCKHSQEQAEQCAYIVHYNGKCDVKKGPYLIIKPMKDGLIDRGLSASIE